MFCYYWILTSWIIVGVNSFLYYIDSGSCQTGCFCAYDTNLLKITITCNTNGISNFAMPLNIGANQINGALRAATSFVASNNKISNFPTNICDYSSTNLINIDLSLNNITTAFTISTFGCLTQIAALSLSKNLIQTLADNTFNNSVNLVTLDLSYNQISVLPTYLFYNKLPKLTYLYLQGNKITQLDPWYFGLTSIFVIDLSNNLINAFTNNLNLDLSKINLVQLRNADLINLSGNKITNFDDSVLRLYNLCTISTVSVFLQSVGCFNFSNNPIACSCTGSYNLLKFYKLLVAQNAGISFGYLLSAACITPATYNGKSVLNFVDTGSCVSSNLDFSSQNCPASIIVTTPATLSTSSLQGVVQSVNQTTNMSPIPCLITRNIGCLVNLSKKLFLFLQIFCFYICYL